MLKKILKSPLTHFIISIILYIYCRFVYLTQRKTYENFDALTELGKGNQPAIIAFWHGRLLFTPFMKKKAQIPELHVIISRHNDGDIIAKLAKLFRTGTIRGSSDKKAKKHNTIMDKGGKHVLREVLRLLRANKIIGITPDGPRGPRMHMQGTILAIASRTNTTILPITYSCSRAKVFNSWDRFMLPLPFGRTHFIIGTPVTLDKTFSEEQMENTRKNIENQLNTITSKADTHVGRTPVPPA